MTTTQSHAPVAPPAIGNPLLVVGPAWVGDMVMAQPLFIRLKQRHPQLTLEVLAPSWSRPLLERMPEVDATHLLPLGHGELGLGVRYRMGRQLRARGYAQAIVLPYSFKAALVPFWARIPRRTGFVGELRVGLLTDLRRLDRAALPRTPDRFAALAEPPGVLPEQPLPYPRLITTATTVEAARIRLGLARSPRVAALCPGAEYGPAKQWPEERFATLADRLRQAGWEVWIFGSTKERELGDRIATRAGDGVRNLAGATSLAEAVDLLALATVVITNDSGLMHVAAALGCKVIAIFGSSDPHHTPPLGRDTHILHLGLPCSPCFKRTCPLNHARCLTGITPEQVWQLIPDIR